MKAWQFAAALLMCIPTVGFCATPTKQVAILIGNADYDGVDNDGDGDRIDPEIKNPTGMTGTYFKDLKHPCQDSEAIARALDEYDFDIYKECNLDKKMFSERIKYYTKLINDLPPNSVVIFYYSGHGLQFNANLFSVPVKATLNNDLDGASDEVKMDFLMEQSSLVKSILDKITPDPEKLIIFIQDACRSIPFASKSSTDDAIIPDTAENLIAHYATNGGNTTLDDGSYTKLFVNSISKGQDIISVMSKVDADSFDAHISDQSANYVASKSGKYVQKIKFMPLRRKHAPSIPDDLLARGSVGNSLFAYEYEAAKAIRFAAPPGLKVNYDNQGKVKNAVDIDIKPDTDPAGSDEKIPFKKDEPRAFEASNSKPLPSSDEIVRNGKDGIRLDVFWCSGSLETANYRAAKVLAYNAKLSGTKLNIGEIWLRRVSEKTNALPENQLARNVLKYDRSQANERLLVYSLMAMNSYANFLVSPEPSEGDVTANYVSAYICGEDIRYYWQENGSVR